MKKEKYLTYQKFNDQAAAAELAQLFQENGLDFELENSSLNFDASFSFNELNKEFRVKIKSEDFKIADEILYQDNLKAIANVKEDYYLFQFSTEELIDLVSKADEWSTFDVVLAEKILRNRGHEISADKINHLKEERLEQLAKPATVSTIWLLIGYLLSLMGGLLGILIGWYLTYHKKILPNGQHEYFYLSKYRDHGTWMMLLGGISFLIAIVLKFYHISVNNF